MRRFQREKLHFCAGSAQVFDAESVLLIFHANAHANVRVLGPLLQRQTGSNAGRLLRGEGRAEPLPR